MKSLDWMDEARCTGMSADIFFPEWVDHERFAVTFCAKCLVRDECLEYGLGLEARWRGAPRSGVFGGMTAKDRDKLARHRRAAAAAVTA